MEIYCAPTADARDVWQASLTHIALEGGCFVLSANQFCRRKDYPPPPEYVFAGAEEELTPDSVVCAGGSVIISPSGAVLAGPNYEGEALISADLGMSSFADIYTCYLNCVTWIILLSLMMSSSEEALIVNWHISGTPCQTSFNFSGQLRVLGYRIPSILGL